MAFGVDYSDPFPGTASLKSAGVTFVCRYLSPAGNPKNLTVSEVRACLAAGIAVCVVWETTENRMLSGSAGGSADAKSADAMASSFGLGGIPVYFAADWDTTLADQTAINAYLDGVASVIGRARTGIYGGYWPVKRAFDAGKALYGWQTFGWSDGQWDSRAQLQQYQNGVTIAGIDTDLDRSMVTDFGQFPRPGTVVDPVLSLGATGPAVVTAQQRLNVWGANPPLVVDGSFGPATQTAVQAFQAQHGLAVDGTIGPATWLVLHTDPPAPGKFPAPSWLAIDKSRLCITWGPVSDLPGYPVTGYTAVAYGLDGNTYATTTSTVSWCVLDGLVPTWTYNIRVWANGGSVAPNAAALTVTMPT